MITIQRYTPSKYRRKSPDHRLHDKGFILLDTLYDEDNNYFSDGKPLFYVKEYIKNRLGKVDSATIVYRTGMYRAMSSKWIELWVNYKGGIL